MRLSDKIVIEARADEVWEYVGSPEIWPLFHVKAGKCSPIGVQADQIGSLYEMEFRLGSKASMTRCEIVEYRIGRLIALKSTLSDPDRRGGRERFASITYELHDLGRKTSVTERIELGGAGIPLVFRALVWLVSRFGKPTGETTLMRLKRIVEE